MSQASLGRFVTLAKREVRLTGEVNVMVTSSRELRRLNRQFRGKDSSTDVLSFPAAEQRSNGLAGDVAISADIASYNACRFGHTAAEEIKILVLHGLLHLAGYDHERDDGQMAMKEARLRKVFGLPVSLTERNGVRVRKTLTAKVAENPQRSQRKALRQRASR